MPLTGRAQLYSGAAKHISRTSATRHRGDVAAAATAAEAKPPAATRSHAPTPHSKHPPASSSRVLLLTLCTDARTAYSPHRFSQPEAFSTRSILFPHHAPAANTLLTAALCRLAYGSLHEASTALLPSGCPLCRLHLQRLRRGNGGSGSGSGARAVGDCQGVTAAVVEHPPPPPPPPRCCDICGLSARVVMRGVGLMERDKDYDNAFHYLEILLQVSVLVFLLRWRVAAAGVAGGGARCGTGCRSVTLSVRLLLSLDTDPVA